MLTERDLAPPKWLPTYAQSRQLLSPPYAVEAASSACAHYVDRSDNRLNHGASLKCSFLLCSVLIQKWPIGYGELFSGKREQRQDDEETQTTAPGTETQPR